MPEAPDVAQFNVDLDGVDLGSLRSRFGRPLSSRSTQRVLLEREVEIANLPLIRGAPPTFRRKSDCMKQSIVHVALVVPDYDEAIAYFTEKLLFHLVEDTCIPEQDKRWVVVAPPGSTGANLLLARPSNQAQQAFIGNQTGGRVTFFLQTDDFWRDYRRMVAAGIEFIREPAAVSYGVVAVFKDLYGNLWDLIEYSAQGST